VALPPMWKLFWASRAVSGMEPHQNHPFGRALGGAVAGARAAALSKRAKV
jgi:hypothetical protein